MAEGVGGSTDRLAESVIDESLSDAVSHAERAVDEALVAFAAARRQLIAAQHELRVWRTRREIGHEASINALQVARLADFVPSNVPPGTHQESLTEYLKVHPPVWQPPPHSHTPSVLRRTVRAATRAVRSIRPTIEGHRRH